MTLSIALLGLLVFSSNVAFYLFGKARGYKDGKRDEANFNNVMRK